MLYLLSLLSIGSVAGFLSGLFGIGGGIVTIPCLNLLGISLAVATATNIIQVFFVSLTNTIQRRKEGAIDFSIAFLMIFSSFVGNVISNLCLNFIKKNGNIELFISIFFIAIMLLLAGVNIYDVIKKHHTKQAAIKLNNKLKYLFVIICGLITGFLMPIMGIGGGFIVVPFLLKVLKFNKNEAVCTANFQMLLVSAFAIINGLFHHAPFNFKIAAVLIVASFFTVRVGSNLSKKISEKSFRLSIATLMLVVASFFITKLLNAP